MRRVFLFFFLIILSCSKDKEPAQYLLASYDVSVDSSEGGSVSYEGGSLEAGTSLTINATPDNGYRFTSWSGDATGSENPLTLEVYSDLTITANFERIKHTLAVAIEGSGQVSQTIVSSAKGEEYNQGSVIRLTAIPDSGSVFTTWSGSSTDTFSEIDITLDGPKTVTATFEEQIFDLVNDDNVFIGTGRWKIRRPSTGNRDSGKLLVCEMYESIYRPDGTFSVLLNNQTINGTYEVKDLGNLIYNIILMVNETKWGTVEDLVITKNYTSFKLVSSGCNDKFIGFKDKTYDPNKDPYVCKIESSLSSGPQTQTVTKTQAIADVEYEFITDCNEPLTASALNLPPGVTMTFDNNIAKISGTPTDQATGTYLYVITANNTPTGSNTASIVQATTSSTIEGSITIKPQIIRTCTISSTLVSGPISQTVSQTVPIQNVTYQFTPSDCNEAISARATNLPPGVTLNFSNNQAVISGIPSNQTSGTYNYYIYADIGDDSAFVTGTISVVASSTTSTSTTSSTTNTNIYFENGICKCLNARTGDTATISGTLYTVVDNNSIRTEVRADNYNLCTSFVTDMENLFNGKFGNFNTNINFWDTSRVSNMKFTFVSASAFNQPLNNWDVSNVTNMEGMFIYASSFNQNIENWDVSNVTNMFQMFNDVSAFNQPLNNWDVSSVTEMSYLFGGATSFDQPLDNWDVSNVIRMIGMFASSSFNRDISNWNTSNVTAMASMFAGTPMNQPLNNWDVSKVWDFSSMFARTNAFNQPLDNWNTQGATEMQGMFSSASAFNQNISNWDTSNVSSTRFMFNGATSFNQPLNSWNTSKITDMEWMFEGATSYNEPLANWDVSNVTNMTSMFKGATLYNQPLDNWNVSNVTNMTNMFEGATSYNQPLDNWNVSNVTNMTNMFKGATSFNQDIGNWDVSNATNMIEMFNGASLFNQDLSGWCVSNIPSNPTAFATNSGLANSNYPIWGTCPSSSSTQTQSYTVTVTAQNSSNYSLTGTDRNGQVSGNDPGITINTGDTLTFNVDASGHPFYLKTQQGTGTNNLVSGINNNGTENGTITWTPTTAGTYYYQCSLHNDMYGTITVN